MDFDELKPKKTPGHEIGCDLTMISVNELEERIALLRAEILRLEADIANKKKSRTAANSVFKS